MILRLINGSQSLPMEWFSYLFMSKCVILFCNHSISVSTRARSTYVQAIHNQNDVMMNTCVTMIAQWGPVSAMKSSSTFLEHHCGFTLYCMFKAFSLCLPMTFHSLPGTDSEVGEYASTHDHIGQLCSLLQDWCKVFNEPLVLNLAAYLRSRDWVCAMCIYNFIPCFNAVLSLSDHCCYIVRW